MKMPLQMESFAVPAAKEKPSDH